MRNHLGKLNIVVFLLGIITTVITMYESFYPHDVQRISNCWGQSFEPLAQHNSFTVVMGIVSLLLLATSGFYMFKQLPKIEKEKNKFKIVADNDLDMAS